MKFSYPFLASLLSLHAEVTPLQTISFESSDDGTFTDFPGTGVYVNAQQALDTFTKFDPSLGTLTEVLFTIQVSGYIDAILSADELISPDDPFSLAFDGAETDFAQAVIIYSPGGGNFGYSMVSEDIYVPFFWEEGLDPMDYGAPEDFYFDAYDGSTFGGFSDGNEVLAEGSFLASDPNFNPADFIGTGNVTGLNFNVIATFGSDGYIDNLTSAFLEATISIDPGDATLQYIYTPAGGTPTPPSITNYSKSGSTHTLVFTGEASKTDWAVKGSSDAMTFPTDHSSVATITETSPGVFQAVIDLSEFTEETHFLRIE